MFLNHDEGATISLHVLPNAPKSQIIGEHNNSLKVKIKAPPVEGKANDAIIKFFSEVLNIPKSRLEILRGDKSRGKVLLVRGMSAEALARLLL